MQIAAITKITAVYFTLFPPYWELYLLQPYLKNLQNYYHKVPHFSSIISDVVFSPKLRSACAAQVAA
jgi:hypothetical protein